MGVYKNDLFAPFNVITYNHGAQIPISRLSAVPLIRADSLYDLEPEYDHQRTFSR